MDRYIIAFFWDLDQVGIYDQVTKISQFTVLSLITVFFNTVNPVLLKKLETDFDGSLKIINSFMFAFLFYGIPMVFYLSLFSKELALILLGEEFREGYILMPFIFWSALVYGISNFFELRMKFSNKIRKLGFIAMITALSNFVMNIFLVGKYGYQWAAYTTLITYLIMLSLLVYSDPKVLIMLREKKRTFVEMAFILFFQYLIYHVVVDYMNLQIEVSLAIGLIFAIIYLIYFRKTVAIIELPMN
jgi:O-antigen/teichoic acid export membrane protein